MLHLNLDRLSPAHRAKMTQLMVENTGLLETAKEGEERYHDSQDWLDIETCAGEEKLSRIEALAAKVREKAEVFVLIGVGGSNNAARSVIEALPAEGPAIVYAGNTLSPFALNQMMERVRGKSVYIDCIAKNFETLEPGSSFRILRQYLYETYGEEAPERIICTGTYSTSLEQLCLDNGYTFIDFPDNVGGRYTAMTNVGLLPMAVAGIDIRALVQGARDMAARLHEEAAENNIAFQYAALRNVYYQEGYRMEILSTFEPQFRWFFKWWMQLFAESEGKDNKGIFPLACEFSEELHSVGQFIQDGSPVVFETFLQVKESNSSLVVQPDDKKDYFDYLNGKDFWDINQAAFNATVKAHSQKLPVQILEVDRLDAYHFGQLFYYFQFACYLSCSLMGVNPFNQPGVEAYKKWMFDSLRK